MYELGTESLSGHREVGEKAALLHVDCLCTVGELAQETAAEQPKRDCRRSASMFFGERMKQQHFAVLSVGRGCCAHQGFPGMRMEEIAEFLTKRSDVR